MNSVHWAHQKALVTGAGGFIGSHLVERLVQLGAATRAFVRYNSFGSWGWLDRSPVKDEVEVLPGDVRDRDSVHQAIRGVDIVFHLAALIGIPYSYHTPLSYMRTNAEGTLNVLQAAMDSSVSLVMHTSTSEVYGTAHYVPIDERHGLQAQSPYSASKIAADKFAEAFHLSFGLPVTIIRPFNTYGPRQSARAVIPTIITQVLTADTVRLGRLDPTRDFNYVADTVDAFVRGAECKEAIGEVIQVGSGHEVTIKEVAALIMDLVGKRLPIVSEQERVRPQDSEVQRLCADNRKAKEVLGWTPSYRIDQGLRDTIEWVQTHLEYYRVGAYVW